MTSPRERALMRLHKLVMPDGDTLGTLLQDLLPYPTGTPADCAPFVDAVLDAIREPTPTMRQAGFRAFEAGLSDDSSESDPTVDLVYRAMIDAIKRGEG